MIGCGMRQGGSRAPGSGPVGGTMISDMRPKLCSRASAQWQGLGHGRRARSAVLNAGVLAIQPSGKGVFFQPFGRGGARTGRHGAEQVLFLAWAGGESET